MSGRNLRGPKGMPDLLGPSLDAVRRVEETARRVFALYGFQEIRPPLLEERELYVRSSGETSEIVEKQMFVVQREGADYVLRPEGTPSVVRAYLQENLHKQAPFQRLWYSGQMFRYERMQKARQRQFHQVGVEVLGSKDPIVDAETIAVVERVFLELGLGGVRTRLNSLGCATCRPGYRDALRAFQVENREALCESCQGRIDRNPLRFLDCKSPGCQELRQRAPRLQRCGECETHFSEVRRLLEAVGVPYELDPTLVRGLDYYTRTLFEYAHSSLGARDAVGGGGRYDGLVEEFGGPPTPAIGFAIGVEATIIALQETGARTTDERRGVDLYVVLAEGAPRDRVLVLAEACRAAGARTELGEPGRSVKGQLRSADASGARRVVVLGEAEFASGRCRLKDMSARTEQDVPLSDLAAAVASR